MNINRQLNFSFDDLDKWGLLSKAKMENQKDIILSKEKPPSKEIIKSIEIKWREKYHLLSDDIFKDWLKSAKLTKERFQIITLRNWMWLNWCRSNFEKEIAQYFLKRKISIDKVIYSVISLKDENIANELYIRIKEEEEPFWLIAKKYSSGPEKYSDGRVGPIELSRINPTLKNLFKVSEIGQL